MMFVNLRQLSMKHTSEYHCYRYMYKYVYTSSEVYTYVPPFHCWGGLLGVHYITHVFL